MVAFVTQLFFLDRGWAHDNVVGPRPGSGAACAPLGPMATVPGLTVTEGRMHGGPGPGDSLPRSLTVLP